MELPKDIEPTADAVRLAIADVVHEAIAFSVEQELPHSEETLAALESALRQNRFTVLVCGEAKRGKSTFINALIGRSLLPTDVDIATSQVFQIRSGEEESFIIRYEDESGQYISPEDLAVHGSQVVQDAMKSTRKWSLVPSDGADKSAGDPLAPAVMPPALTVRQIEVTVPTVHLPQEITLLDTPGLGSLYSGHAKITYRFMPQADAVIFVLDSQAPVTQPELAFLSEIIPVTRHIFFLQTRIDQFQQNDWLAVYERNGALLRETFGEELADPDEPDSETDGRISIWPVSSKNLLLASRTGSQELLRVSRFPAMLTALRAFLFQVTGVARARHVLAQLTSLHGELRPVLVARVAAANGEAVVHDATEYISALRREWGPDSMWRRDMRTEFRLIREQYRTAFLEALQPGAEIEATLQKKIDGLTDFANAERLARTLASEAIERVNLVWRQTTGHATNAVSELISPLCGRLRGDSALVEALLEHSLKVEDIITADQTTRVKDTMANRARYAWRESGILNGVGAAVGYLLSGFGQILPFKGAAVTPDWITTGEKLADQAKPELTNYLQTVFSEIRSLYGAAEVETGTQTPNRTDAFFSELEAAAYYAVDLEYSRKITDFDKESERLRTISTLKASDSAGIDGVLRDALAEWDAWGKHLIYLHSLLDQVATMPPPVSTTKLPTAAPGLAAARESIRARARISATNGAVGEPEKQKLVAEAVKRGLTPEEASAIVESVFETPVPASASTAPPVVTTQDALVAYKTALVQAIRASGFGEDDEIPDDVHARLDELAEAAELTRSAARRMERDVRDELAAAERVATVSVEQTPEARYIARFRVALTQAGGPDADLTDAVLDELDAFAVELSLPRRDVRRIERETRSDPEFRRESAL